MSNDNTLSNIKPLTFEQNGLSVEFKPSRIQKGPTMGNPVLRSDDSIWTLPNAFQYYGGEKEVLRILIRGIRKDEAAAASAAYNENTGLIDEGKWRDEMSGTSSTTTLPELEEELEATKDAAIMFLAGADTKNNAEDKAKWEEFNVDIKRLKAAIEVRKEIGRKRAETRKANAEKTSPDAATA